MWLCSAQLVFLLEQTDRQTDTQALLLKYLRYLKIKKMAIQITKLMLQIIIQISYKIYMLSLSIYGIFIEVYLPTIVRCLNPLYKKNIKLNRKVFKIVIKKSNFNCISNSYLFLHISTLMFFLWNFHNMRVGGKKIERCSNLSRTEVRWVVGRSGTFELLGY